MPVTNLPQWNLYLALVIRTCHLMDNSYNSKHQPTLLQHATLSLHASTNSSHLLRTMVACWDHSSNFTQYEIAHFSSANLTFFQCKSHISPDLQICTGEMWDLHERNVRFVLEKCEICTGEMWDLHWKNVRFALEKCEICTGEMWDLEWRKFIWIENDPNRPP